MATVLPSETPQFAFADHTEFNARLKARQVPPGGIVVAGKNFGCGSSREQAVSTLKGHELVIVARSFARIFLQNAINLGLRVVTAPGIEAATGDELELGEDIVTHRGTGTVYTIERLPSARQAIINAGGLIPYTRSRLQEQMRARTP
jgi:3-isopropylmalate/(R)-2-methylmalate dehydratase small subunit